MSFWIIQRIFSKIFQFFTICPASHSFNKQNCRVRKVVFLFVFWKIKASQVILTPLYTHTHAHTHTHKMKQYSWRSVAVLFYLLGFFLLKKLFCFKTYSECRGLLPGSYSQFSPGQQSEFWSFSPSVFDAGNNYWAFIVG